VSDKGSKRNLCWVLYGCRDRSCPVHGDHIVGDPERMQVPLGDPEAWREHLMGPIEALSCEYFRNLRHRARGKRAVDRTLDLFLERALRRSAAFQRRLLLLDQGEAPKLGEINLLGQFSQLIPTLKSVNEVCFALLTVITAKQGLGFNRAMLFWKEDEHDSLYGHCAIGPVDYAEADRIWTALAIQEPWLDLRELVERGLRAGDFLESPLTRRVREIRFPLNLKESRLARAARELQELDAAELDNEVDRMVADRLDLARFTTLPLLRRDRSLGFLIVDNRYTGDSPAPERIDILQVISHFATSILENLILRESLQLSLRRAQATSEVLHEIRRRVTRAEKLATSGELSAAVAHEIRNPLTAIGGFARRLLNSGSLSEHDREAASVILQESMRLDEILGRLLSSAQRDELHFRPTNLNAEIHDILRLFADRVAEAGITLRSQLDADLPRIPLDASGFRQVMLNLLQNAIEAIDGEGTITLQTERDEEYLIVRVSDTGCGMDAETMKKIFRSFYTTKSSGSGLGLPLSQRIVRKHGGEISVESAPGRGTRFDIRLPLTPILQTLAARNNGERRP
jgi:hypothetical protein